MGRRQALGPLRRRQTSYLGNSDYLTLETEVSFTQGKTRLEKKESRNFHHINHLPADESSVSGLKQDWVEMLL